MKFKINFTDSISLYYELLDHEIVYNWANLIMERNITECCQINHYSGCINLELLFHRINRFYELIEIINKFVPNKITKIEFNKDNFNHALNVMHVHFPELQLNDNYKHIHTYLSEYNDIIHWLEPQLKNYYNNITDNSQFSIKLDFNKLYPYVKRNEIGESAYKLFNASFMFGQLMLHYVHVGRNAWELFFANDLICPKNQYVPQSSYNASIRLHFYNNKLHDLNILNQFKNKWKNFYIARGGKEFFDCDIDDPSIRFGFCQLGSLSEVLLDNMLMPCPKTKEEIETFRNRLVKTKVIDWEIIK
jgi:hypothetical protein